MEGCSQGTPVPLPVQRLTVGGVWVAALSRAQICSMVVEDCKARRDTPGCRRPARLLSSVNGHALSLAARDPGFRAALEQADLVHADGQAVVFASRLVRGPGIPERSATTDLIHDLSPICSAEGLSFFLLGGTEDVNARVAEALARLYPGLRIAGRRDGCFSQEQETEVCEQIDASGADILWAGLGKPLEQMFCVRNRDRLGVTWAITCGGTFRFVIGDYRRAPQWMQAAGLEWLFRALSNPRKLFWRYLTTNPHAVFLLATKTRRAAPGGGAAADMTSGGAPDNTGGAPPASWYRDPQEEDAVPEDGRR